MPLPPDVDDGALSSHARAPRATRRPAKKKRGKKEQSWCRVSYRTLVILVVVWSVLATLSFVLASHWVGSSEDDPNPNGWRLHVQPEDAASTNQPGGGEQTSQSTPGPVHSSTVAAAINAPQKPRFLAPIVPAAIASIAASAIPDTNFMATRAPVPSQSDSQTPPPHSPGSLKCTWELHPSKYIGEFAMGDKTVSPLHEAQVRCEEYKLACKGVTCDNPSGMECTTRLGGQPVLADSATDETSYLKVCGTGLTQASLWPSLSRSESESLPLSSSQAAAALRPPESRISAVVVLAHNRVEYLHPLFESLMHSEGSRSFSFYLSLDDPATLGSMTSAIQDLQSIQPIKIWVKPEEVPTEDVTNLMYKPPTPAEKIGAHFGFALRQAFEVERQEYVVFVENDLSLAPDFLTYFRDTMWLLEADPSLWCVSAWNDNGFLNLVSDEKQLLRTNYFPGLGWMIRNDTWARIRPIWPKHPTTGWDHWIRVGSGNEHRECIMPEVPRTHHISTQGTNVRHEKEIQLYRNMALSTLSPSKLGNLNYLLQDRYERELREVLGSMKVIQKHEVPFKITADQQYIVPFSIEEWKEIVSMFSLYPGNYRGHHNGILLTRHPHSGAVVALVDRRKGADYLPAQEAWKKHESMKVFAANRAESCDVTCRKNGLMCKDRDLVFVNDCELLKSHFVCEAGCGHETGDEIPCHVAKDSGITTAGMCLISHITPKCGAANDKTARLCACLPLNS